MKFKDKFYQILSEKSSERGWQTSFAEQAGIRQSSLSQIINGTTKSPSLDNVGAIVDALGFENFCGPEDKKYTDEKDDLRAVPLMGETGTGTPQELFKGSSESIIKVLPQYYRTGMIALTVRGDSMEPTIKNGAIVGIAPLTEDITEGGIYLVSIPYFGRVVKRLRLSRDGHLLLISDNPDYEPIAVDPAEQEKTVLGKVVWVLQTL